MAPGIISNPSPRSTSPPAFSIAKAVKNFLFNRSIRAPPLRVLRGTAGANNNNISNNTYHLEDGTQIYNASGGAAVTCIGHYNKRVEDAIVKQIRLGLSYVPSGAFYPDVAEDLARDLIASTDGKMSRAVFYSSGSEASEAAMKLCVQYHAKEKQSPELTRTLFIARERSYHGATLGALAISGMPTRKDIYQHVLPANVHTISPCNPYRHRYEEESDAQYVDRLKEELEQKILKLGEKNVAGFIAEPVVGAALGCVPALPGYLKAMRKVCDKYGILLILDEVMCGMGRTSSGNLHAWQDVGEGAVPDIQIIGKGLAGGFQAISGMLVGKPIVDAFINGPGSGAFSHGHTFQNFPVACAAALEVQKIVREEKLLQNVSQKGEVLSEKLKRRLGGHRNVGDIRGKGLFWGIEFVQNKETKESFNSKDMVAWNMSQKGLTRAYGIFVYPGSGSVDGDKGEHIIIAPAYNITDAEVDLIVERVANLIEDFFDGYIPSPL
ncbi:PLP-dependent transferase [Dothidotthia symphoricarpi CBS 119687]|uniref:PLP-dependent transferase n=1 Tax=Dothidotthia symphoricarpi CBS 119687 TaxID=1392245 RepID=A0A6A6A2A5_9PLEO|nr:PLP-dependent transferase [Dothidotthia symphoricarpi CBS 119687]KAF2124711.1 PLP-dependent transferase [Dothidotthia symphoricarpi CBS 119687]